VLISNKWEKFYGNWVKLNENYRKLFIVDTKQRAVNEKTFKWFYGFIAAALVIFCLNLTRGLTALCWEQYTYRSIDRLLFKAAYAEFFKGIRHLFHVCGFLFQSRLVLQ
jgi:hypothetical protein